MRFKNLNMKYHEPECVNNFFKFFFNVHRGRVNRDRQPSEEGSEHSANLSNFYNVKLPNDIDNSETERKSTPRESGTRLSLPQTNISSLLFRVVKTTLSSSYNISGLVPVCWLLFQCF